MPIGTTAILISTEKSGLSLLQSILNCSNEVNLRQDDSVCKVIKQEQDGIKGDGILSLCLKYSTIQDIGVRLIDRFNNLKWSLEKAKLVWLVRNPFVIAMSCKIKNKKNPSEIIHQWYIGNMCMYYLYTSWPESHRTLLKYEDMVVNPLCLSKTFDFLEVSFHKQFLNYGDFDHQPRFLQGYQNDILQKRRIIAEQADPYPKNGISELFDEYKSIKLCQYLGYDRNFD